MSSWRGVCSELSFHKLKTTILQRPEVLEEAGRSDGGSSCNPGEIEMRLKNGEGWINLQVRVDIKGELSTRACLKLFLIPRTVLRHLICVTSFHPPYYPENHTEDETEVK